MSGDCWRQTADFSLVAEVHIQSSSGSTVSRH